MAENREEDTRPMKDWILAEESELRIEVHNGNTIDVKLLFGIAEIFGTELAKNVQYTISNQSKIAIYTYSSCTLRRYPYLLYGPLLQLDHYRQFMYNLKRESIIKKEILGTPDVVYVSTETPMLVFLNTHVALEGLRNRAQEMDSEGPKVMVCGPTDVGKSTLCRILLNYGVRMGRRPVFIDIDVGQGEISIPGTLSVLPIDRPAGIQENEFSKQGSLVYHFGHNNPGANIKLYQSLITKTAHMYEERCKENSKNKYSGCIINTCGWIDGGGYKCLLHCAKEYKVDVVLVLDHERLFIDLQRDLPTNIVRLPKSGGTVARSRDFRRQHRNDVVREYFYGKGSGPLSLVPYTFEIPFSQINVYKIGAPEVPESCLPIGAETEDGNTQLVPVEINKDLVNKIVSLSMANSLEEDLVTCSSAGFLCITAVNTDTEMLTVLSPGPSPLPRKYLLLSDIEFVDFK